jgi:hypothetical protein
MRNFYLVKGDVRWKFCVYKNVVTAINNQNDDYMADDLKGGRQFYKYLLNKGFRPPQLPVNYGWDPQSDNLARTANYDMYGQELRGC